MTATPQGDGTAPGDESEAVLRGEVYRALMTARGITSPTKMARFHGISRQHMYRLLNGERTASLELAMRVARQLETTVEALFQWQVRAAS